jgi:hypothetical protein
MSAEMKEIKGVKFTPEEEKKIDPAKTAVSLAGTPKVKEVEGQEIVYCRFVCPWCARTSTAYCSTNVYNNYICGWCGGRFRG